MDGVALRQLLNFSAQPFLRNFKIDRFSMNVGHRRQSGSPADLDHVPLWIFKVEGQLDDMVEGIFDAHPPAARSVGHAFMAVSTMRKSLAREGRRT